MTILERLASLVGVSGDRAAPPPQYAAVADGLILTDDAAWAWYQVETTNSDLMSEEDRDAETDRASAALVSTLAGTHVHLRVLWSQMVAEDYAAEAGDIFSTGHHQEWTADRVARLDQIALPVRHVLMGVRLGDRSTSVPQRAADLAGVGSSGIGARELATWHDQAGRLRRRLEASPWRCRTAPVDLLAWMIAREQHRAALPPAPSRGAITGAALAALTRGRAVPYPDHIRLLDASGDVAAWVAVLTFTAFPERLSTPGPGEWLRALSEIAYAPDFTGAEGDPEHLLAPVSAEASVRLRVLPRREATDRADVIRRRAKEQRRSSAAQSAEDPGRAVEETEAAMESLIRDLARDESSLVEDHPRLVVTSTQSLADLRARTDAVATYYGAVGIDVRVAEEEQRELWLETWPGDRVRVPDLGHLHDTAALAGTWWWGGAAVGDDATSPVVGYLTGSTPGLVRHSVIAGAGRGDATTTLYVGRSGRGKTTAMMLGLLDAALSGAWTLSLDFKGDLSGLVRAGEHYGVPSRLLETDRSMAGAVDLMQLLAGRDDARSEVPAQLGIITPPHLQAEGAEVVVQQAVNAVMDRPEPATWRVVDHLRNSDDDLSRRTGEALYELAQTPHGAPIMGRPTGATLPLSADPGLWVVQMPGLSLPSAEEDRAGWTSTQRCSVGLMHSMLAYGVITAGRRDLRGLPKAVAIPEVHVLTATNEGRRFLGWIARTGRAMGTHLLMDTQDAETLARLVAVVEQLSAVVAFQLTTPSQQDAVAELLGLPPGRHTRDLIRSLGVGPDGSIRHGHAILRDWRMRAATMQWDPPTADVLAMLDTSPKAAAVALGKQAAAPADENGRVTR
ncbi:ATP-binding protein [Streptomyces sp. NPDC088745]|uniref:ATP-binding protein n=1 Tax=Streptomyces sp. NPDC088745 TaxID=3365884 RepID=UPI0038109F5C